MPCPCCGIPCDISQSGLIDPVANGWLPKDSAAQIIVPRSPPIFVRFKIEQSANCGGANSSPQQSSFTCNLVLYEPATLRLEVRGFVERQDAGYDYGRISLAGTSAEISSLGEGQGCLQAYRTQTATVSLAAGTHEYTMSVDTVDGAFHENTQYEFLIEVDNPLP
jgi:hypothetical protein